MIFSLDKKERDNIDKLVKTFYYNNEVANYLNNEIINEIPSEQEIDDYEISELDVNEYLKDPYYQNVRCPEINIGGYQIKYEKYKAHQCFLMDEIEVNEDDYFVIKNKIAYFNHDFPYLTIQKDNVLWMSVIPHEINTMKKCQNNLSKHIYVLGLGLAYFPYLVSAKVDKITIIENDKSIIKLFKENIFPYFKDKEKYEIINGDAFAYLDKINEDDFIFADLWHNVEDGLSPYISLRKRLKHHKHVSYWIEDSLIMAYRNILINLVDEELNQPGAINYNRAQNRIDEITNSLHRYLLNKKITTYQDLKELLSSDSIKELIVKV